MDSEHAQQARRPGRRLARGRDARRRPSSTRSAPARPGGNAGVPDAHATDRQRREQEQLRPALARARPDDRPDQARVRVGPHARRRLHAVRRVERPALAEPGRRPGAPHARAQQRRRRARTSWAATTPRSSRALLTALKSIDDGNGQTALYNSSVILGMECWSDSSNGHYLRRHPVHPRRPGRRRVPDRPHRRRQRPQQQRPADLGPERVGHRVERVRAREPVQGPDRLM